MASRLRSSASLLVLLFAVAPAPVHAGGGLPLVTLTASDPTASEVGLAAGEFTVTRSGGNLAAPLAVTVVIGGTATNGIDYVSMSTIITIAASETTATRAITPFGDNRIEGDETVVLSIASSANYAIGAPNTDTVTIADNPATVTIDATDAAASEAGLATGEFTVTRSGGNVVQQLNVTVSISGTASNGGDYLSIGTIIVIPANETSATRTITPVGDNRIEGDETVVLTVVANADITNGYEIGAANSDTVTIADSPATVTIDATDAEASEVGSAPGEFTFTRSGGNVAQQLAVGLSVGGTATSGSDYTSISTVIAFPAGETTVTRTITPLTDGNASEGDETVILTVLASTDVNNAYEIGNPSSDTVTIADAPAPTATSTPAAPTSSRTTTPIATATPGATTADHFMAYAVAITQDTDKFLPLGPLTLADRFRSAGYDVAKLGALLTPADENGGGRLDADTHLLEYRLKATKSTAKFAPRPGVVIVNQCNALTLTVTKPVSLLVPAATSLVGAVTKPDPLLHERDHYLCYAAKSEAKLPKRMQVDVTDRFQTRRYDLKKITKLCQPVDKSGSPVLLKGPNAGDPVLLEPAVIRHVDDNLVCYQAKPAGKRVLQTGCTPTDPADKGTKIVPKPPKHTPVRGIHVATQLGTLQVDTKKELELCIPTASP